MMRFVPCRWAAWKALCCTLLAVGLVLAASPSVRAANENGPIQKPKAVDERDANVSGHAILPAPPSEAVVSPSPEAPDAVCATTVLATDGSTSGNARAPSSRYRGAKTVYLITAAELAAAGMPNGASPSAIGWHYSTAPGVAPTNGTLIVYLQNTTDTTFT